MTTIKSETDQTWVSKAYGTRKGLNISDLYYEDTSFLVGTIERVGRVTIVGMTAGIPLSGLYTGNIPPKYLIIDTHGTLITINPSDIELEK